MSGDHELHVAAIVVGLLLVILIKVVTDDQCRAYGPDWAATGRNMDMCMGPDGELRGVPLGCR